MTYAEIEDLMPEEWRMRQSDKLAYRYPRGESYLDVLHRLDPIIHEMERQREPLLIVGHQGILRMILAFFMGVPREKAPYMSIPLNTVIKLRPGLADAASEYEGSCLEERVNLMPRMGRKVKDGQDEPQGERAGKLPEIIEYDPPSH